MFYSLSDEALRLFGRCRNELGEFGPFGPSTRPPRNLGMGFSWIRVMYKRSRLPSVIEIGNIDL